MSSSPQTESDVQSPPETDEVEVSVFGPGVGECIVMHLGMGQWMIVDSCVERTTRKPVALKYLELIGVRLDQVCLLVVTHWHDDHMKGSSDVYSACSNSKVAFSMALRNNEFKTLLGACQTAFMGDSGLTELARILATLQQRISGKIPQAKGPTWAAESKILHKSKKAVVTALSPSDASVTRALNEFGQLLPKEGQPKRNLVAQTPNSTCVVLWVHVGELRILLGADLQKTADPNTGWSAIIASDTRPDGKARVFKVAHHGSANADCDEIWTELMEEKPISLVTPFNSGRKPLPSEEDRQRLVARSKEVFLTSQLKKKTKHSDSPVRKMIRIVAPDLRPRTGPIGHIRFRASMDGTNQRTELFDGAVLLSARIPGQGNPDQN